MDNPDSSSAEAKCRFRYSILINNYNYGRFLKEAVDSALTQTLPAHEIIIVDDGSTDDSLAVLEGYRGNPKIKILTQENSGQCVTVAHAIEHATGDIYCLLDSDDTYKPEYLAEIDKVYSEKPYVDLVFTRLEPLGPPSAYNQTPDMQIWLNPGQDYDYGYTAILSYFCARACFIGNVTSTLSFKRKVARYFHLRELAGQFPAPYGVDGAILLSVSLSGYRKYLLYKQLVNYRTHEGSLNHRKFTLLEYTIFDYNNGLMYRKFANFYKSRSNMGPEFAPQLKIEYSLVPKPLPSHTKMYRDEIEKTERARIARKNFLKRIEHQFRLLRHKLSGKKTLETI